MLQVTGKKVKRYRYRYSSTPPLLEAARHPPECGAIAAVVQICEVLSQAEELLASRSAKCHRALLLHTGDQIRVRVRSMKTITYGWRAQHGHNYWSGYAGWKKSHLCLHPTQQRALAVSLS